MNKFIYIYETPSSKLDSIIKIGEATDVKKRIEGQLNTAAATNERDLDYTPLYKTEARKDDGTAFSDKDIHKILKDKGYPNHTIISDKDNEVLKDSTEWFKVDLERAISLIEQFKAGKNSEEIDIDRIHNFPMRPEQADAVERSKAFLSQENESGEMLEMLWNAKMRFGKTFTAYQLALSMNWKKVLVLTYKPAVENAWKEDLERHVDFKDYVFLRRDTLSKINQYLGNGMGVVAFASYQDLLGDNSEGGIKERHEILFGTDWDVVIIDEFHYGAGTKKAQELMADPLSTNEDDAPPADEDDAITDAQETADIVDVVDKSIHSSARLYLSGTPFKAIANSQFPQEAIYNWTYTDEQKAKKQWADDHPDAPDLNPYLSLPQIQMYLYKVSEELVKAGMDEGKDEFSLNHFFKAKDKRFLNEDAVKKWLNLISGVIRPHTVVDDEIMDEKRFIPSQYPFDHESDLSKELDHTLWYLNRVDSAYALKNLLEDHPVFGQFHIILVAGKESQSGVDALQPVLDAIDNNEKTITISVGKLTTGVSIPKWKGVMFLRDIASPENYFQTAFRAQTPYTNRATGNIKEVCYVFDFSPNRALRLLTDYSEKLSKDSHLTTSEAKLGEFIRYLPVLKVAGNSMVKMDAREVLTFDLTGVDAKGLGERFVERKNIVVNRDTINAINATEQTQQRVQAIFDRIKMFKKFNGATDKEVKQSDVDVGNLDVNDKKIKKLQSKDVPETENKAAKKEIDKAEKEMKSEREKIRELLKTLLGRLPIYMYLTDGTEENLEQVLVEDVYGLFRKTTGIEVNDFEYLVDVGLLKVDNIDGYVLKFVNLENKNYSINNDLMIH